MRPACLPLDNIKHLLTVEVAFQWYWSPKKYELSGSDPPYSKQGIQIHVWLFYFSPNFSNIFFIFLLTFTASPYGFAWFVLMNKARLLGADSCLAYSGLSSFVFRDFKLSIYYQCVVLLKSKCLLYLRKWLSTLANQSTISSSGIRSQTLLMEYRITRWYVILVNLFYIQSFFFVEFVGTGDLTLVAVRFLHTC